ncbi:hypothetical protein [Kitasatospora herbaricolor]|uniref:Alanine-rich protein n=1 Tax=Kitasatospora herbaricolor TaxID=68217 RepID=A0ABZ1WJX4_9ACTN|nr:hypothetical protein [Kitasatospora herbaricolor]
MTRSVPAAGATTGYVYPWDLAGDPAAVDRIVATGVDTVALAAAYHATRAPTPLHPQHRLVNATHAACYVPVRPAVWHGRRLTPLTPAWINGPDPFGSASTALTEAGLPVHAWTVLTHNTALGTANPDLTVHNAYGDTYPYALCPAAEEVADYAETLLTEIIRLGQPTGIVLEACGPLGVDHIGHHDKTELARWTPTQRQLLSLCFCTACRHRYHRAGIDSDRLATEVRATCTAAPQTVEEALGASTADALRTVRTSLTAAFRRRMVTAARAARPGIHVALHADAEPWATGPFATVADDPGHGADTLVAGGWEGPEHSQGALGALAPPAGGRARLAAFLQPRTLGGISPEQLVDLLVESGASQLHLYHLGLVPQAGLDLFSRLTGAARGRRSAP